MRNALLTGTTTHARVYPRAHKFVYPVVYFALDLADLEAGRTHVPRLFAHNQRALYSVWSRDYLLDDARPLSAKVHAALVDRVGTDLADSVTSILLVTTPRFCGYAFNPLSVYYCFNEDASVDGNNDPLVAVILEVNNTFGEKHVYVCAKGVNTVPVPVEASKRGYTHAYRVARSFHVSPFNARRGIYDVWTKCPRASGQYDVYLTLAVPRDLEEQSTTSPEAMVKVAVGDQEDALVPRDAMRMVLYADVRSSTSVPITAAHLLKTAATYPVTVFLTVPRVLREAWKLAFDKGLWVYDRPAPLANGAGAHSFGRARTIRTRPPSTLARAVASTVLLGPHAVWDKTARQLGMGLGVELPDETVVTVGCQDAVTVRVQVREWDVFELLATHGNPVLGFLHAYVARDVHVLPAGEGASLDQDQALEVALAQVVQVLCGTRPALAPRTWLEIAAPQVRRAQQWLLTSPSSSLSSASLVPARCAPLEQQAEHLSRLQQLHWLWLLIMAAIGHVLSLRYFAHMAKFAWSPFDLPARLTAYAAGKNNTMSPAAHDERDDVARTHVRVLEAEERARFARFQRAAGRVFAGGRKHGLAQADRTKSQ
ncbi:hypothetical protein AMAG_04187 [Allomyces macrogynus ATCC 38327]|uniref:DUF1365 domain-containing protein n=1 Tax=Allomyces macrogynus (strain ATCC 38327) TaxID=578462 RepID=A0A0L0S8D2_ALLM3|nr:hypothetical protein AMAG_04187 [Allomyces macrogynus ATCC 38327]|eukprot:KNE58624.1 hypothetical protein AMAG_04187 [Allomyces macrogynus ATCC 38327]